MPTDLQDAGSQRVGSIRYDRDRGPGTKGEWCGFLCEWSSNEHTGLKADASSTKAQIRVLLERRDLGGREP